MGVHTRKDGIEVFNVIENIGESLGYLVRRENPMQKRKVHKLLIYVGFWMNFRIIQ